MPSMVVARRGDIRDAPLDTLGAILRELGGKRVLVITGPSQRFVRELLGALEGLVVEVFAEARRHVPEEVVERARQRVNSMRADTAVSLGGGSATGVAKLLRLERALGFVAVPTTYSGSEYTTLYGKTHAGRKQTGRDPRVLPDVVLRDAKLTLFMPLGLTVRSLLNSMAHPVARLAGSGLSDADRRAALWAVRELFRAIELLLVEPTSLAARQLAFEASGLAAQSIESGVLGQHHALVHAIGGRFDLDHSGLHSVMLPHSVHALRSTHKERVEELSKLVGVADLEGRVYDFLQRAGSETSLMGLGLKRPELETLLEGRSEASRACLMDAFHGRRPSALARREP